MDPYRAAQKAITDLKWSIYQILNESPSEGMKNVQIGRTLGIYHGHEGHEGHIPRSLLALMEAEGVVEQDTSTQRWRIKKHI